MLGLSGAPLVAQVELLLTQLLGSWSFSLAPDSWLAVLVLASPLILMQVAQAASGELDVVRRWPIVILAAIIAALGLGIIILGEYFGQPFIYFQW